MASLPPAPILPRDIAGHPDSEVAQGLEQAWSQLLCEMRKLAEMADLAPEAELAEPEITALVEAARGWQRKLAAKGLEDIGAMLASGLAALAILSARGQDAAAPALALWREVHAARTAVLASLHHDPAA